jgi:SOS response regulatory protein OraA/RecX
MNEEIFEKIYSKVLNFLSYKERTQQELEAAMDKYLYKIPISNSEKAELKSKIFTELGPELAVSDESYAKTYITDVIQTGRLISKKQISNFLYRKGILREVIEDTLEIYYTNEDELRIVQALCDKRTKNLGLQEKAKMINYLISKGFSPSAVYPVVDTKFKR